MYGFLRKEFRITAIWADAWYRATKMRRGGYYCHIEPGNTYISGAFWSPNKDDLLHIRQEIAADDSTFRKLFSDERLMQYFEGLTGEQLKTAANPIHMK